MPSQPNQRLPIYQVDAFTDQLFRGNPAAVCPLSQWLPDEVLLAIARENFLPETAFFVAEREGFGLRWFTPDVEIDLCGHATLATAHVIARHLHPDLQTIRFQSRSGELVVRIDGDWITLDFPSRPADPVLAPSAMLEAIGATPSAVFKARDWLLVFEDEDIIRTLRPDPQLLARMHDASQSVEGIIATAPGRGTSEVDFVSRFFVPGGSIFEDPVTGSAHCTLIPYWRERLGKNQLLAAQLSARGGLLRCQDQGPRVLISGQAVTYLEGSIRV